MESFSSVQQEEQRQKMYGKRQKPIIKGEVRETLCTVLSCFAVMTKKGEKNHHHGYNPPKYKVKQPRSSIIHKCPLGAKSGNM